MTTEEIVALLREAHDIGEPPTCCLWKTADLIEQQASRIKELEDKSKAASFEVRIKELEEENKRLHDAMSASGLTWKENP